ncbi:hypothetical protein G9A89_012179 [Geosiphon pyriformis]|nr:hypothetical protein G9A89_012179 [Geosiphon pyriformis]
MEEIEIKNHPVTTIPKEEKPISSCILKLESLLNPNSNPNNNDDKNNSSSSVQNSNDKNNDINSDSNFDSNYEQYIALLDLTKEQELKWFSNNNESIMPECMHNTNAGFDLRYPETEAIKLEPHMHTCINLKIALKIPATIMGFGSMGRINVSVNMAEEEIVGQRKIISTSQAISIPPYSQYMLTIERKEKKQEQIFEAETSLCESEKIGLINFHILAKSYSHIKIPIYNNTGNVINIPERTTIGYLTTKIEDQPPNPIPDFPHLCGYVDITLQTIYG